MVWKWQKIKDAYVRCKTPQFRRQSTFEWLDSMSHCHPLLYSIVLMIACLNNLSIPFQKTFTFAKSMAIFCGFRGQEVDATFLLTPRLDFDTDSAIYSLEIILFIFIRLTSNLSPL